MKNLKWEFFLPSATCVLLFACDTNHAPQPFTQETAIPFSVRDFGATPNDATPDGPSIRKCIQTAQASGQKAKIVFEPGIYRIDAAPNVKSVGDEWVSLLIQNTNDLALLGAPEGTTLTFTNPSASAIVFDSCRNISLKNIQIDYDPLPYAFGTVRSVDLRENTFDLELDSNSIAFDHQAFSKAKGIWGMVVKPDAKSGTTRYGPTAVGAKDIAPLAGRNWRLTMDVPKNGMGGYANALVRSGMQPGDRYVHMPRIYGCAVGIQACENVRIENVDILSSPGLSFFPYLSRHVSLIDCHVRPGSGRIISANADGIHARGMRGDLLIERCSFEGMGDDAINIHSSAIVVRKVNSSSEIIAQPATWSVHPGDELAAFDGTTLMEKGRTTVAGSQVTSGGTLIRFTKPISGLLAGRGVADSDRLYNLSEAGGPFVIRDYRFLSHRGRAILVSGMDGTIENNFFENNEGWGVDLSFGDTLWAEGPPARDLTIAGNVFQGCGGGQPAIGARSTATATATSTGKEPCFFKNLVIRNNQFLDLASPAIRLYGVNGVLIKDNTIVAANPPAKTANFAAIELENSSGVVISDLKVEDARIKTDVLIGANVDPGEAGVRIASSVELPAIMDRRTAPAPSEPKEAHGTTNP